MAKVRAARELARQALGHPEGSTGSYDGLGAPKPTPDLKAPGIRWAPVRPGVPLLTFADVAPELGLRQAEVAVIVEAAELATVPVGDFGARMVPRAKVERIRADRRRLSHP